jgi:hypothetical protein
MIILALYLAAFIACAYLGYRRIIPKAVRPPAWADDAALPMLLRKQAG